MPEVRARLLQHLQSPHPVEAPAHPAYGPQFAGYELATNESLRIDYLFRRYDLVNSSDEVPISTAFHAAATVTTALLAYLALPAATRAQDLYSNPTEGQRSLPYSCASQ